MLKYLFIISIFSLGTSFSTAFAQDSSVDEKTNTDFFSEENSQELAEDDAPKTSESEADRADKKS